jgi:hypothetical protein
MDAMNFHFISFNISDIFESVKGTFKKRNPDWLSALGARHPLGMGGTWTPKPIR